jgi:hypothetical protein
MTVTIKKSASVQQTAVQNFALGVASDKANVLIQEHQKDANAFAWESIKDLVFQTACASADAAIEISHPNLANTGSPEYKQLRHAKAFNAIWPEHFAAAKIKYDSKYLELKSSYLACKTDELDECFTAAFSEASHDHNNAPNAAQELFPV